MLNLAKNIDDNVIGNWNYVRTQLFIYLSISTETIENYNKECTVYFYFSVQTTIELLVHFVSDSSNTVVFEF